LLGIIPLKLCPSEKSWASKPVPTQKKNCGPQGKTAKLPDVPIREMDTQMNHFRKMIFSRIHDRWHIQFESLELTHPSTKIIEPLQPRLETSMSREPRSHLIESRLKSYSKPNWGRSHNSGPISTL
jgi:hypothetical protein